jgi:hypothetical protein
VNSRSKVLDPKGLNWSNALTVASGLVVELSHDSGLKKMVEMGWWRDSEAG